MINRITLKLQDLFFAFAVYFNLDGFVTWLFPDYIPFELRECSFFLIPDDYDWDDYDYYEYDQEYNSHMEYYEGEGDEPFWDTEIGNILEYMDECDYQSEWLESIKKEYFYPELSEG